MSNTPILQIQEVATSQNLKEVTINDGFVAIEDATQAESAVAFTSNAATLSTTQLVSSFCFEPSGTLTANGTLTIPLQQRAFAIWNTNTSWSIVVGGTTGTAGTVAPNSFAHIYCDGTNTTAGVSSGGGGGTGVTSLVINASPFLNGGTVTTTGTITAATLAAKSVIGNPGTAGAVPQALSLSSSFTITSGGTIGFTTGTIDMSGASEVKVPTPVNATDAATKAYVDATIEGLQVKPTAVVATTAALPTNTYANGSSGVGATLTMSSAAVLTIDGYNTVLGDLILVKNEVTSANNGLYVVTTAGTVSVAAVLTRSLNMNLPAEFTAAVVPISETGTANAGTFWLSNPTGAVTIGTTSIPFTQMNPPGSAASGTGITVSGTTVNLANIASLDILANITGGSAAPIPNTLSAIFDAILGSNQGAIIARGASTWGIINAGTSGWALVSQGTSSLPTWTASVGSWSATPVSAIGSNLTISSGTLSVVVSPSFTNLGVSGTLSSFPLGNGLALNGGSIIADGTLSYTGTAAGTITITPTSGIKDVIVNMPSAGGTVTLAVLPAYSYQEWRTHIKQGATAGVVNLNSGYVFAASGGPTGFTATPTANVRDMIWNQAVDGTHAVVGALLQGLTI